jgi:hypothetical protein
VRMAAATGTVSDASTRAKILAGVEVQKEMRKAGEGEWVGGGGLRKCRVQFL